MGRLEVVATMVAAKKEEVWGVVFEASPAHNLTHTQATGQRK